MSEFGLAWSAHTFEGTPSYEIYFARLSPAGEKIGGDVRITSTDADSTQPYLEWTGTEFGVAWYDVGDDGWNLLFARVARCE